MLEMNESRLSSMKSTLQKPQPDHPVYLYHRSSSPHQSFNTPRGASSSNTPRGASSSNLSVGVDSLTSSEDGPGIEVVTPYSNLHGNANSSCISSEPSADCSTNSMQQKRKSIVDQLQEKINKTKEKIKSEQLSKEDNVNEYLKLSNDADKQQLQRIKAVFEKKNLKSAQLILQLQRKLDDYSGRLKDINLYGVTPGNYRATKGGRLKDVSQGLRDFFARDPVRSRDASPCATGPGVSKARDTSNIFKNKYGSADNITSGMKLSNREVAGREESSDRAANMGLKEGSEEEEVSSSLSDSLASGEYLSMKHSSSKNEQAPSPNQQQPQQQQQQKPQQQQQPKQQDKNTPQQSSSLQSKDLTTIISNLADFQQAQLKLRCSVDALKTQLEEESLFYRQALEEERDRCDRLEEQINDLTELHQNEVFNIKQELVGMQEKMEYQLEERTRDMQELLLTCQTKINKMELQQQQLISMEGIENTSFRGLVTKLINVALALLAVVLVLVSGVANIIGPFLQTRFRVISTALVACIVVISWNNWPGFCQFLEQFFYK